MYAEQIAQTARATVNYMWLKPEDDCTFLVLVSGYRTQFGKTDSFTAEAGIIGDYTRFGGSVWLDLHGIADNLEYQSVQDAVQAVGLRCMGVQ
jgi:hypothetical protein